MMTKIDTLKDLRRRGAMLKCVCGHSVADELKDISTTTMSLLSEASEEISNFMQLHALNALDAWKVHKASCPWLTTRWPNAGMPGGAEL
jgi:hypothetical protein